MTHDNQAMPMKITAGKITAGKITVGFVCLSASLALVGCSATPFTRPSSGGFYGGDAAPTHKPRDFDAIADAIPKDEPLSRTGNKPYTVLAQHFTPLKSSKGYVKQGIASWYGEKFHGRRTSSGEIYNMWAMTAAHPILPLPTYVEVTNLDTGKKIIVKVNDRGPFLHGRIIDLSYVAAHKLGIARKGTGRVQVKAIDPTINLSVQAVNTAPNTTAISGLAGTVNISPTVPTASGDTSEDAPENTPEQGENYFVQVGTYSKIANAEAMRHRLDQQGYSVYSPAKQTRPYRVQVGPFLIIESALQVKQKLERLLGQAIILIQQ